MLNLSLTQRIWKIFFTTWLWKISMWPLYYHPILLSVIKYVRTKWMAPNKCCGIFFVRWFGQVHLSITSKENVVVFFQFEYAEISGYVNFFRFWPQIPSLGKSGQNNQNCQFILKFGIWTNSNAQNSMAMFTF